MPAWQDDDRLARLFGGSGRRTNAVIAPRFAPTLFVCSPTYRRVTQGAFIFGSAIRNNIALIDPRLPGAAFKSTDFTPGDAFLAPTVRAEGAF